ncbi:hypothetical protein GQ55_7G159400 [Panicum hallii var. hallii]|uniref:Uncharacterized protein n=1 Tax=Panicum hallii var. hallii TaxID=1504633 RepID=A0A2T7CVM0_9POAL|nr:hypothetical protein GQ55_7G159400 [Panicum hallii var. hallii]
MPEALDYFRRIMSSFQLHSESVILKQLRNFRDPDEGIEDWWKRSLELLPQFQKRSVAAIQIYTAWNLWKGRNRRVFDQKLMQPLQVFELIEEEVSLRRVACSTPVVS